MPIDLKENKGFIYLGATPQTDRSNYAIAAPYPTQGKAPFTTSRMVDSARNAQGTMVGRMVGRSVDKQELGWQTIKMCIRDSNNAVKGNIVCHILKCIQNLVSPKECGVSVNPTSNSSLTNG